MMWRADHQRRRISIYWVVAAVICLTVVSYGALREVVHRHPSSLLIASLRMRILALEQRLAAQAESIPHQSLPDDVLCAIAVERERRHAAVLVAKLASELQMHTSSGGMTEMPSEGINSMTDRDQGIEASHISKDRDVIPVVVLAYRRTDSLKRCLDDLLSQLESVNATFRIFVSQDSTTFPSVTRLVQQYAVKHGIVHLIHRRNDSGASDAEMELNWQEYYAISSHYHFVLGEIFSHPYYQRVILVEDDLQLSPDFLRYFAHLSPLFDADPSLLCVSAWNDNGVVGRASDERAMYRTDVFPGLGWMISRSIWNNISSSWPQAYWDDWLRLPQIRQGRSCVRPEVSRTHTECDFEGASHGDGCAMQKKNVLLKHALQRENSNVMDMVSTRYDLWLDSILKQATVVRSKDDFSVHPLSVDLQVFYTSNQQFASLAKHFGLSDDLKSGAPRTAYRGVVTFRHEGRRMHLVPKPQPFY